LSATNVLYGPVNASDAIDKATYDARKAIEIHPLLAAAHTAIASIDLRYKWDWIEAEKEFKLAIDLEPDYAPTHFFYANLLAIQRRFDESIGESGKGRSLDPYSAVSEVNYARALYYARQFDAAHQVLQQKLDQNPGCSQCMHLMAYFLMREGKTEDAIALLEKRYAVDKFHVAAALGYAYAKAGRADEARSMFTVLDQSPDPVPSHERALIYLGLRDLDQAFIYFQKSCDERFPSIPLMSVDPLYDEIRGDGRFVALMNRANITN